MDKEEKKRHKEKVKKVREHTFEMKDIFVVRDKDNRSHILFRTNNGSVYSFSDLEKYDVKLSSMDSIANQFIGYKDWAGDLKLNVTRLEYDGSLIYRLYHTHKLKGRQFMSMQRKEDRYRDKIQAKIKRRSRAYDLAQAREQKRFEKQQEEDTKLAEFLER